MGANISKGDQDRAWEVYRYALAKAEGEGWQRAIFALAQGLRGIAPLVSGGWPILRKFVSAWAAEVASICEADESDIILRFREVWPTIREAFLFLSGDEVAAGMKQAAAQPGNGALAIAKENYGGNRKAAALLSLCIYLSGLGGGEFFLSCRKGADALGLGDTGFQDVNRLLNLFEADGILRTVEKGTQGPRGKATRFAWAGK